MSISQRRLPKEEIARRGEEIYDRDVRPILTSDDHGKFVAIDVETGEYEIDVDEIFATSRLRERMPNAQTWLTRVGYGFIRRYGPRRRPTQ
jgi:hypothetical protein